MLTHRDERDTVVFFADVSFSHSFLTDRWCWLGLLMIYHSAVVFQSLEVLSSYVESIPCFYNCASRLTCICLTYQ